MRETFWKDEAGAVAVDWTVLTGAIVGLGIATTTLVSSGTGSLSRDIANALSGMMGAAEALLYATGFETGSAGWLNGIVTDGSDFGPILGPFAGAGGAIGVESTFEIPEGTEVASFTFDMLAIDSWDNEEFIVFVDGEAAASLNFRYGVDGITGQWVSDNPDYSFEVLGVAPRTHSGYNPEWPDQVATVRLDVTNPGQTVTLGFGSTLNQELHDESFAVDNVSLSVE
ncbi:hypothetical protein N8I71_02430 [Roseibacterium sp. SDUM158016]|jgi:Flp pilus assembly pilin Flp|uniref:hypothetical protein n=1 Tax=Roseicyclus sediminis TaxID=2980997 RepID=UPI0021D3826E|nr:hypothetical protein [Roseibacterium sp. SDUM158016]MCU4651667.1 hypothetical protein [Roseibacterium sp. SDUM158016]